MFILSKTEEMYCRLRFNVGPGGEMEIPVSVDYRREFAGSDRPAWEAEYQANVKIEAGWPKERKAKERSQVVSEQQPEQRKESRPAATDNAADAHYCANDDEECFSDDAGEEDQSPDSSE